MRIQHSTLMTDDDNDDDDDDDDPDINGHKDMMMRTVMMTHHNPILNRRRLPMKRKTMILWIRQVCPNRRIPYQEDEEDEQPEERRPKVEAVAPDIVETAEQDDPEEEMEEEMPLRQSTRTTKPVERLVPSMKGQSYHQLEYKHNLMTQGRMASEQEWTYDDSEAQVIANCMIELRNRQESGITLRAA